MICEIRNSGNLEEAQPLVGAPDPSQYLPPHHTQAGHAISTFPWLRATRDRILAT